jgi:hypothetical protein
MEDTVIVSLMKVIPMQLTSSEGFVAKFIAHVVISHNYMMHHY